MTVLYDVLTSLLAISTDLRTFSKKVLKASICLLH
jgi:hypothetical protein